MLFGSTRYTALRTSKKKIIERAIEMYTVQIDKEQDFDAFENTCGAWRREESARETVAKARKAFNIRCRGINDEGLEVPK